MKNPPLWMPSRNKNAMTSGDLHPKKCKSLVVHIRGEHRVGGLFDKGKLTDILIEQPEEASVMGGVYLGRVVKVLPSMQAAFVDIGLGRDGFLSGEDALYAEDVDDTRSRKIEQMLRRDQLLVVQVVKEPVADKGCRLSTDISLPGRFMVLKPLDPSRGVSRKIGEAEERERLLALAEEIVPPEFGVIIRTVAAGLSRRDFRVDYKYLLEIWKEINRTRRKLKGPGLLHADLNLVERALRDNYTAGEFDRVVVDDKREQRRLNKFLRSIAAAGRWSRGVVSYMSADRIDAEFNLRREIARALERKVVLDCGGYLIIEEMETLTAIDVNTGKNIRGGGDRQREIILQTNLEAAAEIPRQLRLRGLGGIIVIDFIDMESKADWRKVEAALRAALRADKAASDIYSYPDLALVHLTRQRTRMSLSRQLTVECPHCKGEGVLPKGILL